MSLATLAFPLLQKLPPEQALKLVRRALAYNLVKPVQQPSLPQSLLDYTVRNPIGIPAGFVKDADPYVLRGLFNWGVGFVEIGSVTPLPRTGNPGCRHWRFGEDGAVNWYGLNGPGLDVIEANLHAFRRLPENNPRMVLASLTNPDSLDVCNYTTMVHRLNPYVQGFTLNRGCPNTGEAIDNTMEAMKRELDAIFRGRPDWPVLVKFGPFIGPEQLDQLAKLVTVAWCMFGVRGFIACNTLTYAQAEAVGFPATRLGWWPRSPVANGKGVHEPVGGFSGPDLLPIAERMIMRTREVISDATIIGVGGVHSQADAYRLMRAGADAVQVLTGFAVHGPGLLPWLVHTPKPCSR